MGGISDSRVVTATSVLLDTEPPRRKSVSALHSRPTYARSPHRIALSRLVNPPDLSWFSGWRVGSSGRRIRVQLTHTSSTHVRPLPLEFAIEVVRGLNSSLHLILSACIVPKTYVFACRDRPAERKHVLKNTRQKTTHRRQQPLRKQYRWLFGFSCCGGRRAAVSVTSARAVPTRKSVRLDVGAPKE